MLILKNFAQEKEIKMFGFEESLLRIISVVGVYMVGSWANEKYHSKFK